MADTVKEIIETITSAEELAGFSETMRDPPPGAIVRQMTRDDWSRLAIKKIELQEKANAYWKAGRRNKGCR